MANDKLQDELRNLLKQGMNSNQGTTSHDSGSFAVSDAAADAFKQAEIPDEEVTRNPILDVDLDAEEKKFRAKGEEFIKSMYKFYLDYGLMSKPEYLENKARLDSINISNIFNQISTTKLIMKGLMGELTRGNMNPRLVESYCTLNNQLSDMIKAQANYVLFLEESYKKSRVEAIEYNNLASEHLALEGGDSPAEAVKSLPESKKKEDGDFFITSDTRTLMDEIQSDKDIYYEDAVKDRSDYLIDDKEAHNLTNPMDKEQLIDRYGVDQNLIKEDEKDTTSFESSVGGMI